MEFYDSLRQAVPEAQEDLDASKFTDDLLSKLIMHEDRERFSLLKKISSVRAKYEWDDIEFYSPYACSGGDKAFSIDDLTDNDYALLDDLELDKTPAQLGLRIADILWAKKRNYKKGLYASEMSYQLFREKVCEDESWYKCIPFLKHALGLAARLGSDKKDSILQDVYDRVIVINGEDAFLFSLSLIGVLIDQNWTEFKDILLVLDKIIERSKDDPNKTGQAYDLKVRIHQKNHDSKSMEACKIQYANYLVARADLVNKKDINGLFRAEKNYEEAIHLYRNSGATGLAIEAHKKLIAIQKVIPNYMVPISTTQDLADYKNYTEELFKGKPFLRQINCLIAITPQLKKEELKKEVMDGAVDPISAIFGAGIKSDRGYTVAKLPPLISSSPTGDTHAIEKYMHRQAYQHEQILGYTALKWGLEIIQQENEITEQSLRFLVDSNPVVPMGRETIILHGLFQGIIGNYYLALHILAPQVENLFRNIAEMSGAITISFNDDDTSTIKLLSSIFKLPELVDCYDEDILFMFEGLLNEKVGANIRNEIAHGIMGAGKGNGGAARFFFCWVLKLLSFTAPNYYKMLQELNKLSNM